MKTGVLILLDILHMQGAENIAVNIAVNLKKSKHYFPIVCATRKGGVLEQKLLDHEITYTILGRDHSFELYKLRPIFKLIKDYDIKIIHAHKIGSNLWGSLISRYLKIPVIAHYHGNAYEIRKSTFFIANKLIGKLSNEIIAVSEHLMNNLIKSQGFDSSKITIIHNSVDYRRYEIDADKDLKKSFGLSSGSKIVGIVGALTEVKNHALLLKAAREVISRKRNVYFLIVGEGPQRRSLEELAVELGIKDNCIFSGFRNDIPQILSIIDIGVLTSHTEGLPLSLIEYMSASKPVVSTDVGGVCELVEDRVNGFLVPRDDYKMLAQKTLELIDNTKLAHDMGIRGHDKVKENFSEQVMMRKIQNVYEKVLSS